MGIPVNTTMHHPYQYTHTMAGQHHHHVLATHHHDIRHREQEDSKEDNMRTLHTQQLDYLYTQLDSLKKNMREKQNCLGKIIDVQKMMIDEQSRVIRDMTGKMTDDKIK